MTTIKENFLGGIQNQFAPEKSDTQNAYALGINVRVRTNVVKPVRAPAKLVRPSGTLQALYTFDDNILIFVDGAAYYRKVSATTWTKIDGISLAASATRVWCCLLPGSTVNFQRKTKYGVADFGAPTAFQPACVFACDGVSQPVLIFPDGTGRTTKNWAQWTADDREYVPICKCPMEYNGKLYLVVRDEQDRFTQIVSSVSGRCLDFVTLVNDSGDKAGTSEKDFGAYALRINVSYDEITALSAQNQQPGTFIVTTARATFAVTQDLQNLIAGEPTHMRQVLFPVGSLGPDAIADLNGDTAVVYPGGIRTFNGVATMRWEGRNSPLNQQIQNLTTTELQTTGAAVSFDNYTGFAVTTKYGPGIVWWDQTLNVFVAVDIFQGVDTVEQFAVVLTPALQQLYFRTTAGYLFQAFVGSYAEAQITLHDYTSGEPNPLALRKVQLAFNLVSTGHVAVDVLSDGNLVSLPIRDISAGEPVYASRVGQLSDALPAARLLNWQLGSPRNAYRSGVTIRWSGGAELSRILLDGETAAGQTNSPDNDVAATNEPSVLVFIGDDGQVNADRTALNSQIRAEKSLTAVIGCGDHIYYSGTQAELDTVLAPYWGYDRDRGMFYAVPGNHDLDTASGAAFFQFMRQTPTTYSKVSFNDVDVFLFNTGYKTDGTQIEVDNLDGASIDTSTQAQWLLRELAASTARNKIVVWHHPPYTSSATYYPGKTQLRTLTQKIADAGATALICGHAHIYERISKYLPIFTVGTGGADLVAVGSTLAEGSQKTLVTYGYLRVTCDPLRAKFEFVDSAGAVRDIFVA